MVVPGSKNEILTTWEPTMSTDKNKNENNTNARTEKQEEKITDLPASTTEQDAQQVKGGVVRSHKDL